MTNGIKVYLRIRPTKRPSGFFQKPVEDDSRLIFNIPSDLAKTYVNNTKSQHGFKFDAILDPEIKQSQVFDTVARQSLEACLDGYNATIFAYGQTGSGKTFTITGGAERYEDRGIIPRALSYLYGEINKRSDVQFSVRISYLEIYNDNGYDLLSPEHESKAMSDLPKVIMKEGEDGNIVFQNLKTHLASTEEDALNLLFIGDTNRAIGETPMNLASSRSHCVFTVFLEQRSESSDIIKRSKIHLVDLAGSERVHKTSAGGQILREAKYINTSLHFLEMVIVALHEKNTKGRSHIPYRNSILTSVLRDSLGGNCKTSMVATISAEKSETEETISTCRFAQRVALVQNDAFINEELDPSRLIQRLKEQISTLKEEIAFLKGERIEEEGNGNGITDMDDDEVERLRLVVTKWLSLPMNNQQSESKINEGNIDSEFLLQPGRLTFDRIHTCFNLLKSEYLKKNVSTSGVQVSSKEHDALLKNLKSQIQQRDNEIAILVNMVAQQNATGTVEAEPESISMFESLKRSKFKESKEQSEEKNNDSNNSSLYSDMLQGAVARTVQRNAREGIGGIKKVVTESPPLEVLADKSRALEFFKKAWPQNDAINENKMMLKEKYAHAKQLGEQVNSARAEINMLKKKIETLRTKRAMQSAVPKDMDDESKLENEFSEKEQQYLESIEIEKQHYKKGFQQLRDMKKEIEHIQQLLEKGRNKLQTDFEAWYSVMLKRSSNQREIESSQDPERMIKSNYASRIIPQTPDAWGTDREEINDLNQNIHFPGNNQNIPLTGNAEADADILAFYRAKEALLSRRK